MVSGTGYPIGFPKSILRAGRVPIPNTQTFISMPGRILRQFKDGFYYTEEVAAVLDQGPSAWRGNRPCDGWWGVECSQFEGRDRVTGL